jgi:hypothetical protein
LLARIAAVRLLTIGLQRWRNGGSLLPLDALAKRTGRRVVLLDGNLWPPVPPDQLARNRGRRDVEVSGTMLPPKIRAKDREVIERPVPF